MVIFFLRWNFSSLKLQKKSPTRTTYLRGVIKEFTAKVRGSRVLTGATAPADGPDHPAGDVSPPSPLRMNGRDPISGSALIASTAPHGNRHFSTPASFSCTAGDATSLRVSSSAGEP